MAAQLEYYKRLNTEKDRVIVALKETPALPTALLKAPLLKIEKRSREVIESEQGSFSMRGLADAKRAKAEKKEEKKEATASKVAARAAAAAVAAQAKTAAAETKRQHNGSKEHCMCRHSEEILRSDCAEGHGHLCGSCGEVKTGLCRVKACNPVLVVTS
jgi:hypothetical protein